MYVYVMRNDETLTTFLTMMTNDLSFSLQTQKKDLLAMQTKLAKQYRANANIGFIFWLLETFLLAIDIS
jgi:hypothetical protein